MKKVGEQAAARILAGARALAEDRAIVLQPPAIPEHPNYVMFDLEGLPPQLDELETIYLWGIQVFGEQPGRVPRRDRRLRPATATARAGRRSSPTLRALFAEHGDIPFVHWASYERTKINLYLDRYGDRDGIAAPRQGQPARPAADHLRVGRAAALELQPQAVEVLAGYERQLEEFGGDWSMAKYIEATETRDAAPREAIMGEILAYNREDLEATWAVMEWLRALGPAESERCGTCGRCARRGGSRTGARNQ